MSRTPTPTATTRPATDDRYDALEKRVAKLERDSKKSADAHAMIRASDEGK